MDPADEIRKLAEEAAKRVREKEKRCPICLQWYAQLLGKGGVCGEKCEKPRKQIIEDCVEVDPDVLD